MTDGLKTGQRIALWLVRNRADKIKTIALAGQMIASELYLHGDAAAADTISMLAGPYCNNRPLLDGIGAFGTRAAPTSFAAPRYTYVRRNQFAQDALYADLDIIPMVDNYDGSTQMPGTFLPLIPLVLLNGIKGIATGWSTNILPRKLEDLVGAVQDVLSRKPVRELLPHYENLDVTVVPVAGEPGKYIISGRAHKKNTSTVLVTELPPGLTLEAFRDKLGALEEAGDIQSFTDRSTKTIDIEIKMTRAALGKLSDKTLIDFLKLRTITTENITVQGIGGSNVITYDSAEALVKDWTAWRLGLYLDRYVALHAEESVTNLYWRYILACFRAELPSKLITLDGRDAMKAEIAYIGKMESMDPPTGQILERITGRASYKWTAEGHAEAVKQLEESDARLAYYEEMVKSDRKRKGMFKREVGALT